MFPSLFPRQILNILIGCIAVLAGTACRTEAHSGEAVARQYCGSCHAFPEPDLLPKKSWEQQVLPAMGKLMGLQFFNGVPYQDVYADEINGNIQVSDWKKILDYYKTIAPAAMPLQQRTPLNNATHLFEVQAPDAEQYPGTVFVSIDPGNQQLYMGSASDSSVYCYNKDLVLLQRTDVGGTTIDIRFSGTMQDPGNRAGILTHIGILHLNEGRTGSVIQLYTAKRKGAGAAENCRQPASTSAGGACRPG